MRWLVIDGVIFVSLWTAVASDHPVVEFTGPFECQYNHGVYRWDAKTDHEAPPQQIADDHKVTPSVIAAWPEPRGVITTNTPRSGREKEWYQVTGKVVL